MEIDKKKLSQYIRQAISGNQHAYKFLLDTFWNYVYNFQLSRVKNEMDAEDITIETFSKAFDKLHTYKEEYTFKVWLTTISKNIHIDKIRKQHTLINTSEIDSSTAGIVDDSPTPEDSLITQQNLAQLLQDIKQLKPHYSEVIQLRYFREMSYKEIADRLDEPVNNIKVKLLRARKLLAEIIDKRKKN